MRQRRGQNSVGVRFWCHITCVRRTCTIIHVKRCQSTNKFGEPSHAKARGITIDPVLSSYNKELIRQIGSCKLQMAESAYATYYQPKQAPSRPVGSHSCKPIGGKMVRTSHRFLLHP